MLHERLLCLALLAALTACAGGGPSHAALPPGAAGAEGRVRLVPRAGVTPGHANGPAYADRRLRDVRFVDYDRPGFAVVWAEAPTGPGAAVALAVQDAAVGPRLAPAHLAVGVGGRIVLHNDTRSRHTISCPTAGLVQRLAPGETIEIPASVAGEASIYLLDAVGSEARVFVSPGPFTVASDDGRFALQGLAPGVVQLHAWHPRFPQTARAVALRAGESVQVDLDLGVDRPEEQGDAAH